MVKSLLRDDELLDDDDALAGVGRGHPCPVGVAPRCIPRFGEHRFGLDGGLG
jgi:hypothetical protein